MHTSNLGILAHVDAGKTTLTERLLHAAGAIDAVGRVDDGTTQTDSMALERARGITIRAAVVTFTVDDVTVNIIDTPGHPDFIAEVDRSLRVLDGAVLVLSAVEGVQAQTIVLLRALRRLGVPTIVFVNKIDRAGAEPERVLSAIRERLSPQVLAMGGVDGAGERSASFTAFDRNAEAFLDAVVEALVDGDEALLGPLVDDRAAWTADDLWAALARQVASCDVLPVLFGSAVTGAGIAELMGALTTLLPVAGGDPDAPASAAVFKVDRSPSGEKVAHVRMFDGTIRRRDRVRVAGAEATVTAVRAYEHGAAVDREEVRAGEIAQLLGLAEVRVGDTLGVPGRRAPAGLFPPPTLETAVVARDPAQKAAMHAGLTLLAEQDPLIDLRQDDIRQELFVSLYGEVQKEIVEQTFRAEFGVEVEFRSTGTICIERPTGSARAIRRMGKQGNPYLGTVGLRLEPGPVGSGIDLRVEADVTTIPLYVYKTIDEFHDSMESYVATALASGLHGWPVTDCLVTVTDSDYTPPSTTAGDFRKLTPLVVAAALRAGTVVCEPIHRFHVEAPADCVSAVLGLLARARATPEGPTVAGSWFQLDGTVPAAEVVGVQRRLPGLTRGEGVLEAEFDHYQPVVPA